MKVKNRTHSQKKMSPEELVAYKNRFNIPLSDADAAAAKYFYPGADSEEIKYLLEHRKALVVSCRNVLVTLHRLKYELAISNPIRRVR